MVKRIYIIILVIILWGCDKIIDDSTSNSPKEVFQTFWEEVDRHYSFFEYQNTNWDSIYYANIEDIDDLTSDEKLFSLMCTTLDHLNDAHTNLYSPFGKGGNTDYFDGVSTNELENNIDYFSNYFTLNSALDYAELKSSNLAYVKIKTFSGEQSLFEVLEAISTNLQKKQGIIIDVRSNLGGYISNAQIVLGYFTTETLTACQYRYRNGGAHTDFSDWQDYKITPSNELITDMNIAVITNRMTYSAAEWFVVGAQILPQTTIVGDTTGGGSGRPITRDLPNGWILKVSNTQVLLPSGDDFQFTGLIPDVPITMTNQDYIDNRDALLEKAIDVLTQ